MKHDDAWSHLTAWRSVFLTFSLCTWRNTFPVQFCKTNACAFDLQLLLPSAVSETISYELWVMTVAACTELWYLQYVEVTSEETPVVPKHGHPVQDSYNSLAWCLQFGKEVFNKNKSGKRQRASQANVRPRDANLKCTTPWKKLASACTFHFPHAYYTGLTRIWRFFKAFPLHFRN